MIRTRAGVTHTTTPEKILRPLPGPRPARAPRPLPDDGWPTTGPSDPDDTPDWREKFAAQFATKFGARRTQPAAQIETPTVNYDPDDPPPF